MLSSAFPAAITRPHGLRALSQEVRSQLEEPLDVGRQAKTKRQLHSIMERNT